MTVVTVVTVMTIVTFGHLMAGSFRGVFGVVLGDLVRPITQRLIFRG